MCSSAVRVCNVQIAVWGNLTLVWDRTNRLTKYSRPYGSSVIGDINVRCRIVCDGCEDLGSGSAGGSGSFVKRNPRKTNWITIIASGV